MSKWRRDWLIAYRTKDSEGDVWSEKAFLFKSQKDVEGFFVADNPVLLDMFTEEGDRKLYSFKVHKCSTSNTLLSVFFETEYAGDVIICQMMDGIAITPQP